MKIGFGYDSHTFTDGDCITIGGEKIPFEHGIQAHSDGDVLLHALCDALLGAAGLGDIGKHFPDSNPEYRNYDSSEFVKQVLEDLEKNGFRVGNVDCTVVAERPKLANHRSVIENNLGQLLKVSIENVNVKATTNEGMGFIGRGEGIAAFVVVLLLKV